MEETASALEALEEGLSGRFNHEELTKLSEAGYCSEKDFHDATEKDLSNLVRGARLGNLREHLKVAGTRKRRRREADSDSSADDKPQKIGAGELQDCFEELRATEIKNDCLAIPAVLQEIFDCPSTIHVREQYRALAKIADKKRRAKNRAGRKLCVTGTPGTGKTLFTLFYVWWLVKEERATCIVLDLAERQDEVYFISSKECKVGAKAADFSLSLSDPHACLLTDAKIPFSCGAFQLETSSPLKAKIWTFNKRGGEKRIMGPWSLAELLQARRLYPDVSETTLRRLFKLWGGTIRWTLALAKDPCNEQYLRDSIEASSIQSLKKAAKEQDDLQLSSRILHHLPDKNHFLQYHALGSKHISGEVFTHLAEQQKEETINLLSGGIVKHGSLKIRGQCFEAKSKLMLQGNSWQCRDVHPGSSAGLLQHQSIKIPKGPSRQFFAVSEVKEVPKNCLWDPVGDLETTDFIIQPNILVQATVNPKHKALKAQILLEHAQALTVWGQGGCVQLLYVVPADLYNNPKLKVPIDAPDLLGNRFQLKLLLLPYTM